MELISREEALKVFGNIHSLDYNAQAYKSKIEKLPTIQSTDYEQGYHDGFVDGMNYKNSRGQI